jgi:hypothetical protein
MEESWISDFRFSISAKNILPALYRSNHKMRKGKYQVKINLPF